MKLDSSEVDIFAFFASPVSTSLLQEPAREEQGKDGERRIRMSSTSRSDCSTLKEDVQGNNLEVVLVLCNVTAAENVTRNTEVYS